MPDVNQKIGETAPKTLENITNVSAKTPEVEAIAIKDIQNQVSSTVKDASAISKNEEKKAPEARKSVSEKIATAKAQMAENGKWLGQQAQPQGNSANGNQAPNNSITQEQNSVSGQKTGGFFSKIGNFFGKVADKLEYVFTLQWLDNLGDRFNNFFKGNGFKLDNDGNKSGEKEEKWWKDEDWDGWGEKETKEQEEERWWGKKKKDGDWY